MVSGDGTIPFWVISLNTPEGEKRRQLLNFEHSIEPGFLGSEIPPGLASKFVRGRYAESTIQAIRGGFFAHLEAWRKIAKGNTPVCVCEDDAYQLRPLPKINLSQEQGICLLGGAIRGPDRWETEVKDFVNSKQYVSVLSSFKEGVNIIDYSKHRWTMCIAYIVNPAQAAFLVDLAEKTTKKLRAVDIWLSKTGLVRSLMFPNIFTDNSKAVSQCNSPPLHGLTDFYVAEFIRRAAKGHGIIFPKTGASFQELQDSFDNVKGSIADICLFLVSMI